MAAIGLADLTIENRLLVDGQQYQGRHEIPPRPGGAAGGRH